MGKHAIDFSNSPRLTEQHHKDKCCIRRIVKSASRTGIVDHLAHGAAYRDALNVPDFKTAMDQIAAAKSVFASMPAKIRTEFQNDPARFVAFCTDPKTPNSELVRLGLGVPVEEPPKETKSEA